MMELDLLTFSPSQVKKQNIKISTPSKKATKLSLRPKRLISSKENYCSIDGKSSSTPYSSTNQNCEFSLEESISLDKRSSDKRKFRVARGKENRGISANCISLLISDTANIVNNACSTQGCLKSIPRRRRKLSSDDNLIHSKRFSAEKANNEHSWSLKSKNPSNEEDLISQVNKNVKYSTQKSTVLANESLEQPFNKCQVDKHIESSVIVISDSGEETVDVSQENYIKNRKSTFEHWANTKRETPGRLVNTIVLETSESENEHSHKYNEIPVVEPQDFKKSPNIALEAVTHTSPVKQNVNTEHMDKDKYSDIKNWLSGVSPFNKKSDTVTNVDNVKTSKNKQKQFLEKKTKSKAQSDELNTSAERVLDEIYGLQWRTGNAFYRKFQTEPHRIKNLRNVPSTSDISNASCSSSSGTSSANFERFLNEKRTGKFESTRRFSDARLGTPDFINDSVDENSLRFYQNLHTDEIKREAKKLHKTVGTDSSNNFSNHNISRRLSFSSSSDEGAITPKVKPKKITKEPKKVVRKQKVLSPVNGRLKAPKTEKPFRSKPVLKVKQVSVHCSPVLSFLSSLSAEASTERCHPEALYYKQDYQKKKEELCQKLFKIYNSEVFDNKLPKDLLIQWSSRINKSAGLCYNKRTIKSPGTKVRASRIVLSTKVCDTADRLRDTLIHELCHAACWIVDEVKDGHGHKWKSWARKAMRVFPELPVINRCHDYKIFTKYTYRCTRCGYSVGRHSKSLDIATKRCGYCYGMFELLVNTRRKSGTVAQKTPKKRSPVGFARYVKENYGTVKKTRSNLKHADVMKLLGQQFSAVKIGSA